MQYPPDSTHLLFIEDDVEGPTCLGICTSRDTRFSTYDLLIIYFVIVLALTLTTQDAYDGGNERSNLISTIIFEGL
jgi:hypothetical protein